MKPDTLPIAEEPAEASPAKLLNPAGRSPVLLVCEHASNHIPAAFANLGLSDAALDSHIAWDPGALAVARGLGDRLDARLVTTSVSRLVYDCNRPPDSPDAIPETSETYDIPGNRNLSAGDRAARVQTYYRPFHDLLAAEMAARPGPVALVTLHSFAPVYFGRRRATEIGVIHDADARLADQMLAALAADGGFASARNDPYGPEDGVTHSLRTHAVAGGVLNVMLEIRNDLIATTADQQAMADGLAAALSRALANLGINPTGRFRNAASS